jgi:hypothetical protein
MAALTAGWSVLTRPALRSMARGFARELNGRLKRRVNLRF